MSANVFAFPGRGKGPQPWTNDELAELYRVVDLLGRAGLSVATDMGMSDEGDPWFVFCRVDNDEVIAHFARIDGIFVAASIAVDETFRGANFRQIVDRMVTSQPLVMPRPAPGSKLFLHPAVMLTAFVATALAHSEKAQALDWLHAVEAQWGHGKAAILAEVKHIKTGWFDTLHTLLKMPLHDGKIALDSSKESQALTLVSLIAIAMSALQPIAEKISMISHLITDELQGHSATQSEQASAHAAQLVQDMAIVDGSSLGNDHGGGGGHGGGHGGDGTDGGGNSPELHKVAAVPSTTDSSVDAQHAAVDLAVAHSMLAVPTVQKMAVATDDTVHAPAAQIIEVQSEASIAAIVSQKAVATAATSATTTATTETLVFSVESANVSPLVISADDVTVQAKTALFNGKTDTNGSSGSSSGSGSGTVDGHTGSTDPQTVTTTPVVTTVTPVNQVVNTSSVSLNDGIQTITDFVNNESHAITSTASLTVTDALQTKLGSYFGSSSSLTVVFFDTTSTSVPDIFLFSTSGVVFIEEKDISPDLHLSNAGGNLTLEVDSQGGTVTLVGVATIAQHTGTV